MSLSSLIDKYDNFEVVRDQIAGILALETVNQQTLATAGGKDPNLWKFKVFTERSQPWEEFLGAAGQVIDSTPRVNVWFESADYTQGSSDTVERQTTVGTFHCDIIALGTSKQNGSGHTPGDQTAAFEAQRIARLVRNILMSAENTYLGLRGLVWRKWPRSLTAFQPSESDSCQQVQAMRLTLDVQFNEFAPQVETVDLETIAVTINRAEDGSVYVNAQYDY